MVPPCLTLSNIRYVSRVKWSNPGKGVAPSPTSRCSSYWKESLLVALDYGRQFYLLTIPFGQWLWASLVSMLSALIMMMIHILSFSVWAASCFILWNKHLLVGRTYNQITTLLFPSLFFFSSFLPSFLHHNL